MNAGQDIVMPQLGQAMTRGTVVEWCAAKGDVVIEGSHLLTIESDKFTYEIETPSTGILERLVEIGEEAEIGTVLGRIGDARVGDGAEPATAARTRADAPPPVASATAQPPGRADRPSASPKARFAAAGRIDLDMVQPSRRDGLIVAADVERAIRAPARAEPAARMSEGLGTGARLQKSWQQAPHFVQMIDVDATALAEVRRLHKAGAFPATLNDVLIWAAARALAAFPAINARIRDGRPVRNETIDISLAVATDRGLRTPTVRDAGGRSIAWVAEQARRAIDGAAGPGGGAGGPASLTISNLGAHGVRQGTPVLNLDEAVLIFAGAIAERPCVTGGAISIRHELTLSIAFDHRIVDGLEAARFTACVREQLETFDLTEWRQADAAAKPAHGRAVTLRSDRGLRCDVVAGGHRWTIDEPAAIGGNDAAADPVLHMLGALLSCMTIALKVTAARRRVAIERIAGSLTAPPTGKVRQVALRLEIWSPASCEDVEALLGPAKASCHVHDMLRKDLEVAVELVAHPAEMPS